MCYLSICLYFFYFCQVIGTPSFPLLSVMRPSLQKYWRSTKYSTRKCSTIHTLPVICSHSVLQCLLQTTSLQIIANAINIKSLLFVILQQNISGSHPAGTLCKLHATKTKGLEYISFQNGLQSHCYKSTVKLRELWTPDIIHSQNMYSQIIYHCTNLSASNFSGL